MLEIINGHVLLPDPADWSTPPTWKLRWEMEVETALRGNEGRSALRSLPRPTLTWQVSTATLQEGAKLAGRQRAGLALAAVKPGCFAAPAHGRAGILATAAGAGANTLTLRPGGCWHWQQGDTRSLPADHATARSVHQVTALNGWTLTVAPPLPAKRPVGTFVWPVFFGRRESAGGDSLTTPDEAETLLTLTGDGLLPAPAPEPPLYLQRPVFTLPVNWAEQMSRELTYDLRTQQIGFGAPVVEAEQQYAAAGYTLGLALWSGAEIAALEAFLQFVHGRLRGFWMPAPEREMEIVAAHSATEFDVATQGLPDLWNATGDLHLHFSRVDLQDRATAGLRCAQVASVAALGGGLTRVTLAAPLDPAPGEGWDVRRLLYVRLTEDELEEGFAAEGQADVALKVYELPVEYRSLETGDRPALLYRFTRRAPGFPDRVWRFTSYDQTVVTAGGEAWTPAPLSHGELSQNTKGDSQNLEITAWLSAGSPFAAWLPFPPPYDLAVEVLEADLTHGGQPAATLLFTGMVGSVRPHGRKLTVACTTPLDRLGVQIPRFKVQTGCNYCLFDPFTCRVPRADWTTNAAVVAAGGASLILSAPGVGTKVSEWWAYGDAQFVGPDGLPERRTILHSAGVPGQADRVALTLDAPPAVVPGANSVVPIAVGCDLTVGTCKAKFNNLANYGGHPFVDKNLTLKAIDLGSGDGGKGGK